MDEIYRGTSNATDPEVETLASALAPEDIMPGRGIVLVATGSLRIIADSPLAGALVRCYVPRPGDLFNIRLARGYGFRDEIGYIVGDRGRFIPAELDDGTVLPGPQVLLDDPANILAMIPGTSSDDDLVPVKVP
ncbi:hypothetical protein CEY09_30535 [Achromobacter marplatensis]|uniref:Uncharacterized protein n=1 Tax=Achromobacter marplatensis TaxID=470868 RepID=A0ABX9FUX2_9BURK|nr:hypothetical protein [Achromobacter marplatensis]OWT55327.1 hypothetical protein CEY09_30535 [Achromobacter marplatensis]RBP10671.1 hypothetical protein DFP87_12534 [Achromobacter marplatensis]CAB3713312.1 hypothetical protein LMG26219_06055 [Achromobacter marplatensis]